MSKILLATSSVAFEQKVRKAMGSEFGGEVVRWQSEVMYIDALQSVKELASEHPDVVAIGPNVPVDIALDLALVVEDEHPEIKVVLISEVTAEIWERALRSGVRDVISPDAEAAEMRQVFERLVEAASRQRHNLAADSHLPKADHEARIITVLAPKGGVGKTTVASSLAVSLAGAGAGRVAVVDLDLQFGDMADTLGLKPEHTIADLSTASGGITATTLKVFLTRRGENLYALCAPDTPAAGEEVTVSTVERAVRHLAADFDYIVIDTSAGLNETTLAAVEMSTDLVFVCDVSVSALRSLRKVLDAVNSLGLLSANRHFVLNRSDSKLGISNDEVEAVVGMPIGVEVPASRHVAVAMNEGVPVVETVRGKAGRALASTASMFTAEPEKKGLAGAFRRKI